MAVALQKKKTWKAYTSIKSILINSFFVQESESEDLAECFIYLQLYYLVVIVCIGAKQKIPLHSLIPPADLKTS